MIQGQWTTKVARKLSERFGSRGLDVLYAHGQKGEDPEEQLGQIACWFGTKYESHAQLAFLDIAVVSKDSNRALLLVEIEERNAPPKKLIADALTTLVGDHIMFQGRRDLKVGPWTRLVVLAKTSNVSEKRLRPALLQERLNEIKGQLQTGNASMQQIVIATFQDESDLEAKLIDEVEETMRGAQMSRI